MEVKNIFAEGSANGLQQVVNVVDTLLAEAVRQKASDVHIEPLATATRVRVRVDGLLRTLVTLPPEKHAAIVSRIKIMSGMDIAEKRLPQDGRMDLQAQARKIDVRVSSMPTLHGEKLVLRLLDKSQNLLTLENLHFNEHNLKAFANLYQSGNGIVLVTGPTGSGKSTTLYAALSKLNSAEQNIITIEDPVEYQLEGVNQVAVNKKAGLTFATGLRSIVRQDPNIIMVGEIRDKETAQIAMQAALTGHLVLSTLHTNNAVGAVTRLLDIGIEAFLVAAAVRGVVAQRLVRCVCPCCAQEVLATAAELAFLERQADEKVLLLKGQGCEYCFGTGYSGRIAVQEVLPITQAMQSLLTRGADEQKLLAEAERNGFTSMRADAIEKVLAGKTTVEEVLRVVEF